MKNKLFTESLRLYWLTIVRKSLILLVLFASTQLTAQRKKNRSEWDDKKFISVNLKDTSKDQKIVVVEIGQKATIFLHMHLLRHYALEIKNDYNHKYLSKVINFLDSGALVSDTICVDQFLGYLDYLVSQQLQDGNAMVFYKKLKSFVPTISHRLEKYGMYAHRFFYLPDQRPFYSTMELSGIIENNKYTSDPNELLDLGEKLAGLRKE